MSAWISLLYLRFIIWRRFIFEAADIEFLQLVIFVTAEILKLEPICLQETNVPQWRLRGKVNNLQLGAEVQKKWASCLQRGEPGEFLSEVRSVRCVKVSDPDFHLTHLLTPPGRG